MNFEVQYLIMVTGAGLQNACAIASRFFHVAVPRVYSKRRHLKRRHHIRICTIVIERNSHCPRRRKDRK